MRTLIPLDLTTPKTRLSTLLSPPERETFATVLLEDVLSAVAETDLDPVVVATEPVSVDVPVRLDDRPLDAVVNDAISAETPLAIVMADLGLAEPDQLRSLLGTDGDVVIAPGRGGGTNALVVRDDAFRVDYHGVSFQDHLRIARKRDLSVSVVDSFRLASDVDTPEDLIEVLLHSRGTAPAWLRAAGIRLETSEERPTVVRE
jgi:2-phospho-L-lactate guanylyltransferase